MRASRDWLLGLILIVATLLAYQPAWHGRPIWDDDLYLRTSQSASTGALVRIWTQPKTTQQYHPLVDTVFWSEANLWDRSMLGHHLLNILLHAISALLLLKILQRLALPGAWLAAAVFALHPVHVESVAWLVEMKNTLSGIFFFGALLAYLRFDRTRSRLSYVFVLVLFFLGLTAKTVVATLPVAILIVIWWKRGKLDWKRDLLALIPLLGVSTVAGLLTAWMERRFSGAEGARFDLSGLEAILIAGRAFWFYLAKLFWPADLILIYPRWQISPPQPWQYLFLVAALLLFGTLWFLRKRSRAPLAALLFFGALLFPMLGFFNVYYFNFSFVADHFQYLPSAGIIVFVCGGIALWLNHWPGWPRRTGYAACFVLLATLASLTWRQSRLYRDAETCFRTVTAQNPTSATAQNNLGTALFQSGEVDEAIAHFQKALELKPDYQFANYNLGAALLQKGEPDAAIPQLKKVLAADPNHPKGYYTLANALAQKGELDQAIAYYERAVKLVPDFGDAHGSLGNAFLKKGDIDSALIHYRRAVELEPDSATAHYNLAVGLVRNGQPDEAVPELKEALRIQPDYPDAGPLLTDILARKTPP